MRILLCLYCGIQWHIELLRADWTTQVSKEQQQACLYLLGPPLTRRIVLFGCCVLIRRCIYTRIYFV